LPWALSWKWAVVRIAEVDAQALTQGKATA
jgi:hypothetical protein